MRQGKMMLTLRRSNYWAFPSGSYWTKGNTDLLAQCWDTATLLEKKKRNKKGVK